MADADDLLRSQADPVAVTEAFHRLYYDAKERTWDNTYFLGRKILKNPMDLWVYQELVWNLAPDLIIETGTFSGASALYFATLCDVMGKGEVVTVDIVKRSDFPEHPRISFLHGPSTNGYIVQEVAARVRSAEAVLVILDSDHAQHYVAEEMRLYAPFVSLGSYLVVEDTNINGHPVCEIHGPGPTEAIEDFVRDCDEFVIDPAPEKFFFTFNPKGYLRRVLPHAGTGHVNA